MQYCGDITMIKMPSIHIVCVMAIIWKMYTNICAIYEVITINHVIMCTVQIFDIYH